MPAARAIADDEALHELEALLCAIAAGQLVARGEATSYLNCRQQLLDASVQPLLPGFLFQCISLLRFRDFITLYDPDVAERHRFIRRAFEPCRAKLDVPRRGETGRREESQSQHWML